MDPLGDLNGRAMEALEIQNMVSDEDTAPQEDLRPKQFPVIKSVIQVVMKLVVLCLTVMFPVHGGDQDEEWGAVEDIEQSNQIDQSMPPDLRPEQSAVTSNSKVLIQVTVALMLAGGSFAAMYAVPGGVNDAGRAVMGDAIAFNVFLIADTIAFLASLAICMIVATVSHISAKMEYLIRITLWATLVCSVLSFHASAYVVVNPNNKWIVLCFGGAVTIAFSLLLLYRLSIMFLGRSGMTL